MRRLLSALADGALAPHTPETLRAEARLLLTAQAGAEALAEQVVKTSSAAERITLLGGPKCTDGSRRVKFCRGLAHMELDDPGQVLACRTHGLPIWAPSWASFG